MNHFGRYLLKSLSSPLARQRCKHAYFHTSAPLSVLKPYILADIGEGKDIVQMSYVLGLMSQGIKEVQIIQWFVEPEARVEQFDKICEVQSDKAAVDVSSLSRHFKKPRLTKRG